MLKLVFLNFMCQFEPKFNVSDTVPNLKIPLSEAVVTTYLGDGSLHSIPGVTGH